MGDVISTVGQITMHWNYHAAYIAWNSDQEHWEAYGPEEQHLVGRLTHILQQYGQDEWELVNITAERWVGPMAEMNRVTAYRAFFRRPQPDISTTPPTEAATQP
jgi:hypothetical protein